MAFWTYMLHCNDRTFYVGHTDDLEKRIGQHEQGLVPGYTSKRLPVKLVWTQEFTNRDEARRAEAQLKGWSRAKKLALIRGDWSCISALAKSKEGASTGSAKPVVSGAHFLSPHLDHLPSSPLSLEAGVRVSGERLFVRFRLTGVLDELVLPLSSICERRDKLWQHTCFEAFVEINGGPAYQEFNFSPSNKWAAYCFDSYREGMSILDVEPPDVRQTRTRYALECTTIVSFPASLKPTRLGLSGVIEESSGRKSYWALAHPAAKPDFHHPDSFVLTLPEPR